MGESPTTPVARPTVLVCDDEPVLRMLVRATLDQGNYTVVEACDGDEALARRAAVAATSYASFVPIRPRPGRP